MVQTLWWRLKFLWQTDGRTDGRTDWLTDRQTDGWMRFNVPTLSRKRGTITTHDLIYDKFKFVSHPFTVRSFSVTCPFVVRFVRFLYVAFPFCPLLPRYLYGEVRYVSVTCPVDLRYSYGTCPFNTPRGSLGQQRRRLSRTDDQRTKVFGRFLIRYSSVRVIRLGVTEPLQIQYIKLQSPVMNTVMYLVSGSLFPTDRMS